MFSGVGGLCLLPLATRVVHTTASIISLFIWWYPRRGVECSGRSRKCERVMAFIVTRLVRVWESTINVLDRSCLYSPPFRYSLIGTGKHIMMSEISFSLSASGVQSSLPPVDSATRREYVLLPNRLLKVSNRRPLVASTCGSSVVESCASTSLVTRSEFSGRSSPGVGID